MQMQYLTLEIKNAFWEFLLRNTSKLGTELKMRRVLILLALDYSRKHNENQDISFVRWLAFEFSSVMSRLILRARDLSTSDYHLNFLWIQSALGELAVSLCFCFYFCHSWCWTHECVSCFKQLSRHRPEEEKLPQRDAVVFNFGTVSLFILTMHIFKSLHESWCNLSMLHYDLWHLNAGI